MDMLMRHKEAQLARALLTYAAECLHDGDYAALRDLGFGEEELRSLQSLTIETVTLLSHHLQLHGHVLKVRLDRGAFRQLLAQVHRESERTRLKRELVRREAPAELMASLYDMGVREYTGLRRAVRLTRGPGRPPDPDEATIEVVWRAWKNHHGARDPAELTPEDWLLLSNTTDRDLRVIYRILSECPATPAQRAGKRDSQRDGRSTRSECGSRRAVGR
ncbi:hypothetical protein Q668_18300 [Alcanivorax sp. PN-3]|nr:hypothetical protein Q668_18300 [Alcanivorax sp. PN-3]